MLTRRQMIQGTALGLVEGCLLGLASRARAGANVSQGNELEPSVIFINLKGGLSHIDSFDPKPEAAGEYRGEFGTIATSTPGVTFCEHLPRLAKEFQKFAVVRSVTHSNSVHHLAQQYIFTGDRFSGGPAMGSVASEQLGRSVPPVYVAIPNLPPYAGLLGPAYDPYNALGDGGALLKSGPDPDDAAASKKFRRRVSLLNAIDGKFTKAGIRSRGLTARQSAYGQAVDLIGSKAMRQVTDLDLEPASTRKLYGDDRWAEYMLLARRFVETGTRFVAVTLDDRGGFGSWDTHINNFVDLKDSLLPRLDRALAALFTDLDQRGAFEKTLVVVMGEMGRSPKVNGNAGRDHHPRAASMLWAGCGVQGGRVVGATDETGDRPAERPVNLGEIAFTVLTKMGIDPTKVLLPPHGRRILPRGKVIEELFS